MAELSLRLPENVPGKYYIDEECINCGLCVEIAPNCFSFDESKQIQYVSKQAKLPSEINQMEEAIDSCPTEAIGNDGD